MSKNKKPDLRLVQSDDGEPTSGTHKAAAPITVSGDHFLVSMLERERAKSSEVYELSGPLLHELDAIVASWNMRGLAGHSNHSRATVLDALLRWACITDADLGGDPGRICDACEGVGVLR